MTVTPVSIPLDLFETAKFELSRNMSMNRLYGGVTQVREAADPRWTAEFTTIPLTRGEAQRFKAFWDSMRGGLVPFYAYDPEQQYPAAYPTGTGADFVGAVVSSTANTITVNQLSAGFVVTAGDFLSVQEGVKRLMLRSVADATADGSGVVTVTVEPRVMISRLASPTGDFVNFDRPACVMTPVPGSWSYEARGGTNSPVKFSGIETVV